MENKIIGYDEHLTKLHYSDSPTFYKNVYVVKLVDAAAASYFIEQSTKLGMQPKGIKEEGTYMWLNRNAIYANGINEWISLPQYIQKTKKVLETLQSIETLCQYS